MARDKKEEKKKLSRRQFVVGSGTVLAGGALAVAAPKMMPVAAKTAANEFPLSKGYLIYDSRHCAGCQTCMLTCSLVHDGEASTSRSRIQVTRNVLAQYPQDIEIFVCRQCPEPLCVQKCPTGACHISAANGNVRMIDTEKCIGCKTCLTACPHVPHRPVFNVATQKSSKCDLCANAPYFSKKGGPLGAQACVTTCPAGALKLVAALPSQTDNSGYDLNFAPPPPPVVRQPSAAPRATPTSPETAAPAKAH
jgi:protein NrfC